MERVDLETRTRTAGVSAVDALCVKAVSHSHFAHFAHIARNGKWSYVALRLQSEKRCGSFREFFEDVPRMTHMKTTKEARINQRNQRRAKTVHDC